MGLSGIRDEAVGGEHSAPATMHNAIIWLTIDVHS
jgi:hypothetical protein